MGRYSGESPYVRVRQAIPVAQPAAGADWTLTVPGGHLYVPLALGFTLATSAAVANRLVRLGWGDGVRSTFTVPYSNVQAASLTWHYSAVPDVNAYGVGTEFLAPLPPVTLPAAWTIGTRSQLLDAADQFSSIFVHVIDVWVRDGALDLDSVPDLLVEVAAAPPAD